MPAGRPLTFKTPEALQEQVDLYFLSCSINRGQKEAPEGFAPITEDEHPTICGLAVAIGTTRKTLLDYEERGEFCDTVKSAKARVEQYLEQRLFYQNAVGTIFNLKNNFGWKDKQETEHSGPGGGPLQVSISSEDSGVL